MKPAWDQLMSEYQGSSSVLIADVDCTAAGKDLCQTHGVEGFPTLKWGDPSALESYEGGRELEDLQKFAKGLGPMCGPKNLDLCDEDKKNQIKVLEAMPVEKLTELIEQKKEEITAAEKLFEAEVEKLQARYEELQKEKDATLANIKKSGLGLMQAVRAHVTGEKEEL